MKGKIPISDAADICKKRGCAYVIVFGVKDNGEQFHVTSYGKTKALCKIAGNIADQFAEAVLAGKVAPPDEEPPDGPAEQMREWCIENIRKYLQSDSQRAVSWHEIQDCIQAIRS